MILETKITNKNFEILTQDINNIQNDIDKLQEEFDKKNILYKEYKETKYTQYINNDALITELNILKKDPSNISYVKRLNELVEIEKKRINEIQKYTNNQNFILTKNERKEKTELLYNLKRYLELEKQIEENIEENDKIREINKITEIKLLELQKIFNFNYQQAHINLKNKLRNKTEKLQILLSFYDNQLILKKYMTFIKENNIDINDDDDYEDIKNKCILYDTNI